MCVCSCVLLLVMGSVLLATNWRAIDGVQWFPAVVCQPGVLGAGGHAEYLIEYENTKLGSQTVQEQHLRICHDFDWYQPAGAHVVGFAPARAARTHRSANYKQCVRCHHVTRLCLMQVQELGAYSSDRGNQS